VNRAKALYKELYSRIEAEEERIPCQDAPDVFFIEEVDSNRNYKVALSRKMCGECPVRLLCLEYALEAREAYGIWGGFLPSEREQMNKDRRLSA
jgi:WhiB family redox-sensing transcriptional regulator